MSNCENQCLIEECCEIPFQYTNYDKVHKICKKHLDQDRKYEICRVCREHFAVLKNHSKLKLLENSGQSDKIIQNKLSKHRCILHQNIEQNIDQYLRWVKCKECYCFKCNNRGSYIASNQLNTCFNPCNLINPCKMCLSDEGRYYLIKNNKLVVIFLRR